MDRTIFQRETEGTICRLDQRKLNDYIRHYLGEELTAKDFRAVMRQVGAKLGNTAAVARSSYVSPAVVEQYLAQNSRCARSGVNSLELDLGGRIGPENRVGL